MSTRVTVLDYGIGNMLNVVRALRHVGAQVSVVEHGRDAPRDSERMVLPGVGAFANGMREMNERGLSDVAREHIRTDRPFLGICVGMQMLFDGSEEFGETAGLGFVTGRVTAVAACGANGLAHRIPHIGWTGLRAAKGGAQWRGGLLSGVPDGEPMYFVHSFHGMASRAEQSLATVDYDGVSIGAAVQCGNAYGVQFHPERSGRAGLDVLRTFLTL